MKKEMTYVNVKWIELAKVVLLLSPPNILVPLKRVVS
jgi:hypothetical protein